MERRVIKTEPFQTREENGKRYLDGYYSVFNRDYEVYPGWVETIAPGAFSRTLRKGKDVKVLWNHNADIVLGSTENRTAVLSEGEIGVRGPAEMNGQDREAREGEAGGR